MNLKQLISYKENKINERINSIGKTKQGDYIKVIDYKSGNTRFDLVKLYHGVSLQLAMYMNAAMGEGDIPGGMLYYHIDDPVIDIPDEISQQENGADGRKTSFRSY